MPSLWFVCPVFGRLPLARICLRQLRRTCDELTAEGIEATAVVIADHDNLKWLWQSTGDLFGFGTVNRDNEFLSRKFNDGIQLAFDRPLPPKPREATHGRYVVTGKREYRGHPHGTPFSALLDRNAEARAVRRGDIQLLDRFAPSLEPNSYTLPEGWESSRPADYVVPVGSDDFVNAAIFHRLPDAHTVIGFQHMSFVSENGEEMVVKHLRNTGGCGIRIYPRQLLKRVGCRPADEDRKRACDTSILTNLQVALGDRMRVDHADLDPRHIVDWKSAGENLNSSTDLRRHPGESAGDPFAALDGVYPDESLGEMAAHYGRSREPAYA